MCSRSERSHTGRPIGDRCVVAAHLHVVHAPGAATLVEEQFQNAGFGSITPEFAGWIAAHENGSAKNGRDVVLGHTDQFFGRRTRAPGCRLRSFIRHSRLVSRRVAGVNLEDRFLICLVRRLVGHGDAGRKQQIDRSRRADEAPLHGQIAFSSLCCLQPSQYRRRLRHPARFRVCQIEWSRLPAPTTGRSRYPGRSRCLQNYL